MEYRRLGRTDLKVSAICLGTMTWGEQNTEAEGHAQMDYAVEQGINFFDTAELYSIPPKPETQGSTERIIGSWFKARGNRDKVILASKVIGRSAATVQLPSLSGTVVMDAAAPPFGYSIPRNPNSAPLSARLRTQSSSRSWLRLPCSIRRDRRVTAGRQRLKPTLDAAAVNLSCGSAAPAEAACSACDARPTAQSSGPARSWRRIMKAT